MATQAERVAPAPVPRRSEHGSGPLRRCGGEVSPYPSRSSPPVMPVSKPEPPPPATSADLEWWLTLAPTLQWVWARSYAASAPHWYIVLGKTPGLTRDDFIRVGLLIRTFG